MTLVATWVRPVSTLAQLVVVSDSRITGGETWDWCPKVLPLPRPMTIAAVAGDMTLAYAYLIQAVWATVIESGNANGRVDIANFAHQIERFVRTARSEAHLRDLPRHGEDDLNAELFVGGWSWRRLRFEGFRIHTDRARNVQIQHTLQAGGGAAGVHFMGSGVPEARERLKSRLCNLGHVESVQWEPLEVLTDMSLDESVRDVGGAPQLVVANQNGITDSFLAVWPEGSDEYWCGGRPLGRQRSDLRAFRTSRTDAGRLRVEFFFPPGLSVASSEIARYARAEDVSNASADDPRE